MSKNNVIYIVIGIIVLAGLFYLLKPKTYTAPTSNPVPSSESTSSAQPVLQAKIFDLVIKDKKLISGPETLQVLVGDQVIIKVTANEDEEFHLHGYDKSIDLKANQPAELKLAANISGRFLFELEHSKVDLGALEVAPK